MLQKVSFKDENNGNELNNVMMNLYTKKPVQSNAASSDDPAISIDISSDEEDNGNKQEKPSSQTPENSNAIPTKLLQIPTVPSSNGTKANVDKVSSGSMNSSRPGPASQKKRRLESTEVTPAAMPSAMSAPLSNQQLQSSGSKPKKFKKEVYAKKSSVTFSDVGGMNKALIELCELILHIKHPEMYKHIGLPPPRGFLLHGAPGCGKTLLAHAIAGQLDVLLIEVPATELVAGVSGESEERIREIFEQAASFAPCVLFIDEIDAISSNRQTAQKDMERRIVSQLLASLDNLSKLKFGDQVLVIGATNRPDSLDPALRRVGRFDHEISLGIPDRQARSQILEIITRNLKIERPFNFDEMASLTPGYVGADLLALAMRAASTAIKREISDKTRSLEKSLTEENKPEETPEKVVDLEDDALLMEIDSDANKADKETEGNVDKEVVANIEETEETTKTVDVVTNDETESKATEEVPKVPETPMEVEEPRKDGESSFVEIAKQPETFQLTLENMMKWLQNDVQPMNAEELEKLAISRNDFLDAVKHVQPSAKREGFITVPDVTWDDIGSLQDIRAELKLAILAPVKYPKRLEKLGLHSPSGVLLCGPPGCGKTLLAKAVANEAGINFISVKGPELLNMVRIVF